MDGGEEAAYTVVRSTVDHSLQDFDYHVAKRVWNALAMNADLVGNPEAVREILYAASEPPQRPARPDDPTGMDSIDPSRIDYGKLVRLVRAYESEK